MASTLSALRLIENLLLLNPNSNFYVQGVASELSLKPCHIIFHTSDKNLYGAAGTATSHYCRQSNWGEVFTMATVIYF